MSRAKRSLLAFVAAAGGLLIIASRSAPAALFMPTGAATPFAACRFRLGDRAAFRLASSVEMNAKDAPQADTFTAVLSWEVVAESTPGSWLLRAGLSSVEVQQQLSQHDQRLKQTLDAPFMVRVDRDCRFTAQGFSREWEPTTRRFVSTTLRTYELALSHAHDPAHWEVEQTDGMGTYLASYEAKRLPTGEVGLRKTKLRYREEERATGLGFQVQLVHALAEATLERDGHWFLRATVLEQVRLKAQGALLADLEQRASLVRDDSRFVAPQAIEVAALDWRDPFVLPTTTQAPVAPEVAHLSLAAALHRFDELYASREKGDAYAAALFLAQWLRAHPEQTTALLERLRTGAIAEARRPAVFLALEQCGTPEARAALTTALRDKGMAQMDRARAASALSDVPSPTLEAAAALVDASRTSEPKLVASTSVRALGHLLERTEHSNPELAETLRATLEDELSQVRDTSRAVDLVDAVGNTGDERFIGALEVRLADAVPSMREHAARAFRGMAQADAAPALLARWRDESDPAVKVAIIETLLALGVRTADALALAQVQLATEPVPIVRGALIRFLGAAVDIPLAHTALTQQFHREKVPQLLQLIGRYLSAEELR
jgi:hypothetical protein